MKPPTTPAAAPVRHVPAGRRGVLLTGLVGRGIQGSRSPALHTQEATAQGLQLSYELIDLDAPAWAGSDLGAAIGRAEQGGFAGVNITYPFKQDVIPLLHELSRDAERLGAVNTVLFREGRRIGHNTDWSGFAESLRRGLPGAARKRVLQVGAGGAGAAVAYALLREGVERLSLFDTDRPRADALASKLRQLFGGGRAESIADLAAEAALADGLVNATPVGMANHPGMPAPAAVLRPGQWVADIVYVPLETELLAAARARGCRVLDGGGMTVFQAAEAFRLFTDRAPDVERMRAAFLTAISVKSPSDIRLHD